MKNLSVNLLMFLVLQRKIVTDPLFGFHYFFESLKGALEKKCTHYMRFFHYDQNFNMVKIQVLTAFFYQ